MNTQKTKAQILHETISRYNLGNRAVNHAGNCRYLLPDGRMCAVGACMIEPSVSVTGSVYKFLNLDYLLKDEYRGQKVAFWSRLQTLHDSPDYWDKVGLSGCGKVEVQSIVEDFSIPTSERFLCWLSDKFPTQENYDAWVSTLGECGKNYPLCVESILP